MAKFEDYAEKYKYVAMERHDGILQLTFHTDGGPMIWGGGPHQEMGNVFADIGSDHENQIIIVTGTGESFIDVLDTGKLGEIPSRIFSRIYSEGKSLLMNLLNIEVPMIAAINGPATVHAELGVLCDIVLAAEHATFADAPHFTDGIVPGDGVHLVWPLLLGPNRGRYFLLTGQHLSAQEALDLGVVNEVLPKDQLLDRAWELARLLAEKPPLTRKYTRVLLTQQLKRMMLDDLGYGLALEGLAASDYWPGMN